MSCGTQKSAKIPLPVGKMIWSFWWLLWQTMTEAAFFTVGRSRTIGYGKIRPSADYRSRSRLFILFLKFQTFILFVDSSFLKNFKKRLLIRNCNDLSNLNKICMFFPETNTSLMLLWSLETRNKDVFWEMFNGRLIGQKVRQPKPKADY